VGDNIAYVVMNWLYVIIICFFVLSHVEGYKIGSIILCCTWLWVLQTEVTGR
jgi:hypothetical protein